MSQTLNPAPVPTPAPAPAPAPAPWYSGYDAETKGFVENRGWAAKKPEEALNEAIGLYRLAEKAAGAPPDKLVRLPDDPNDVTGLRTLWDKLGVPKDPNGYDLTPVKFTNGAELDPKFADFAKSTALELGLTPAAAQQLAKKFVQFTEATEGAASAEFTAKVKAEHEALQRDWAANFTTNQFIASQAAKTLGIPAEAVKALEGSAGYAAVMKMFHTLGLKMGEDRYVTSPGGGSGGSGLMSKSGALAQLAALKADTAFVSRYLAGDREATRQMSDLHKIIAE
jgi:hypothetical protein